jgi:redox-sensitive bicupin YhaK (pirin superfamily)
MLDHFSTDNADDYRRFPAHPHRGLKPYLLGNHTARISLSSRGELKGGVQWMTAGRGIIHSEMHSRTRAITASALDQSARRRK